jgi:4-hydroxybenzoate polyprenyltransferase
MKRITWWPQVWLGLTFNWGVLVGYAAVMGHLDWPAIWLYAGCVCWTVGYDTIYAQQDMEDDALIGVKSTARLFGTQARVWIGRAYGAASGFVALGIVMTMQNAPTGLIGLCASAGFGAHLYGQWRGIPAQGPQQGIASDPLALFKSNATAGMILVLGLLAYALTGWVWSIWGQ